jgi:hypothetical protein
MGRSRDLADGTLAELNVDSNTLAVDATNNRVGIGITPSTKLDVSGTSRYTFNVDNAYTLQTSINAAGSAFADDYKNAAQHIWQTSGTERMRILSSGGITFNGDTAAANALDDYEEGTWTPDVFNNGKSSSWTTKIGTYQKIGQFVFAEFACDSGASAPSAGGALILSGLPYNIAGMATAARIIGTAYCNTTTNSPAPIFFYGGASSTAQIWYAAMNGQDQARLTSGIFGTVMYPAA